MGHSIRNFHKIIEQNDFFERNYHRFKTLTNREKEILVGIAKGKTSQEIGKDLFIAKYTVDTHRRNIFSKLEEKTYSGLYKYAMVYNLI